MGRSGSARSLLPSFGFVCCRLVSFGKAWTCLRQERGSATRSSSPVRTRAREMLGPPGRSDVAAAHRAALRELRRGRLRLRWELRRGRLRLRWELRRGRLRLRWELRRGRLRLRWELRRGRLRLRWELRRGRLLLR